MAKRFQFRLEKLLQLRSHDETLRQKELAVSLRKVNSQQDVLHDIDGNYRAGQDDSRMYLTGKIDTNHLVRYSRYFLKLKKDRISSLEVLKALEREREKRRQALLAATRRRQILEKLRDRKKEAYTKRLELVAQKEQDEIASNYALQKNSSRFLTPGAD